MIALARRLPELRGFSFLSSAFIGMQNTGLPLYSNDPRSGETHLSVRTSLLRDAQIDAGARRLC